jgi:hypothetical protein
VAAPKGEETRMRIEERKRVTLKKDEFFCQIIVRSVKLNPGTFGSSKS